jgi:hypothetical protein
MTEPTQDSRITSLEVRVSNVEAQTERTRRRLHELENDRASVRLLAGTVQKLVDGVEEMARRTAEATIAAWWDQRMAKQRESWRVRLTWLTSGAAVVSIVAVFFERY